MSRLHAEAFRGKVPRASERLIGPNYATEAMNCKITSGRLDFIKGPLLVHTSLIANAIKTIYRHRLQQGGVDNWMVWDRVVDVVKSPNKIDLRGSLYYTGDGEPRMSTYADAIAGAGPYPAAWYVLGVYIGAAPTILNVFGGTAPVETRSYIYTFVTQYGEEGPPSLPISTSGNGNGTWQVVGMSAAPPNNGTVTGAVTLGPGIVEVTLNTVRGISQYEELTFTGIGGMSELNGTRKILTLDAVNNKVTVALATTQPFTAGGTWDRRAPHNIFAMKKRLYRSAGANSVDYKFVAEMNAGIVNYDDNIATTNLGGSLITLNSYTPPKDMHSLKLLPNGCLAGISGNQLCVSDPYMPYSWPLSNRYPFEGLGVALGTTGNSVIVLTDGFPAVATITVAESVNLAKMPTYKPCVSKAGVVDAGSGVIYPSNDGLQFATPTSVSNLTEELYTFDEWQQVFPSTLVAAFQDDHYYGMHDNPTGEVSKAMVMDVKQPDSIVDLDVRVDAIMMNPYDGRLYIAQGSKLLKWDEDDSNRFLMSWKSREYQVGPPLNFSVAQIHAKFADIAPINTTLLDANVVLMASILKIEGATGDSNIGVNPIGSTNIQRVQAVTANRLQFSYLSNGKIVFTKEVTSSAPFRLPDGFKSEIHQFQVASTVQVHALTIAQGFAELAQTSGAGP